MHCTACSSWFKIGPINEMNRIEWRGNNFKNSLYINNINCTKSMTLHKTKVKLFFFTRFAVQLAISSSTNSNYLINPTSDSVSLQYYVIIYFTNIFQKTFFRYFWIFFLIKSPHSTMNENLETTLQICIQPASKVQFLYLPAFKNHFGI